MSASIRDLGVINRDCSEFTSNFLKIHKFAVILRFTYSHMCFYNISSIRREKSG